MIKSNTATRVKHLPVAMALALAMPGSSVVARAAAEETPEQATMAREDSPISPAGSGTRSDCDSLSSSGSAPPRSSGAIRAPMRASPFLIRRPARSTQTNLSGAPPLRGLVCFGS